MPIKIKAFKVTREVFFISSKEYKSDCHGVNSQKIKSQKLHVPILETNRKNLHPQKKTVIRYQLCESISMTWTIAEFGCLFFPCLLQLRNVFQSVHNVMKQVVDGVM